MKNRLISFRFGLLSIRSFRITANNHMGLDHFIFVFSYEYQKIKNVFSYEVSPR